SSKGLSIMVKEDSQVLKLLKKGDIFEMQYYPVKSDSHPISHKTEIKHISKPDPGTCKGHILVGLLILE
ncbi:hypothetical protein KAJ27_02740, partial [bacterium]|nr:hypothetical protein [bacterium]